MRKTFFDILENLEINAKKEYDTLLYLFTVERKIFCYGERNSVAEFIDNAYFRDLEIRGRYTALSDMMSDLELNIASDNIDDLFVFCEFLAAVMPKNKVELYGRYMTSQYNVIMGNIKNILDKTNHQFVKDPQKDRLMIFEKSKTASLAAQIVEDNEIAFELLEYNHYALKNNLSMKRKILASIGAYIEPILRERTLSNCGYKDLESNAGFLLNKFNIRHNNKDGKTAQDYIVSISDEQLEKWYDRTYDVLIQVIITNENIAVEKDIKQLKQDYTWR